MELYYKFLYVRTQGYSGAFDQFVRENVAAPIIESMMPDEEEDNEEVRSRVSVLCTAYGNYNAQHISDSSPQQGRQTQAVYLLCNSHKGKIRQVHVKTFQLYTEIVLLSRKLLP